MSRTNLACKFGALSAGVSTGTACQLSVVIKGCPGLSDPGICHQWRREPRFEAYLGECRVNKYSKGGNSRRREANQTRARRTFIVAARLPVRTFERSW